MWFCGPKAHEDRLQATDPAPAEVPSGWLTPSVLDNSSIVGYNYPVRSDRALGACRVRYARKSYFVFVRTSCLWFLPPSAVEKSRSAGPKADLDRRSRAACRKVAEGSPTSRLLNLSTAKSREQSQNVYENKEQKKVEQSGSADRRFCGLRLFHDPLDRPRTANTALH
jgi:hypothetical protein